MKHQHSTVLSALTTIVVASCSNAGSASDLASTSTSQGMDGSATGRPDASPGAPDGTGSTGTPGSGSSLTADASTEDATAVPPVAPGADGAADAEGTAPQADASANCSPGGGGGPTGGPADMFPCDSYWYKDVSSLPAYTTEDIIGALDTWGNGNKFQIDFSIMFMHAPPNTPPITVSLDPGYDPDNDHDPVPIPPGGALEGENGYTCTGGGDCHLIVVDDANQKLFELWQANQDSSGAWSATNEAMWNLTEHYGPYNRGLGCTSADAAGFAILPGLIGVREVVVDQEIKHALRYILPNDHMRPHAYVTPASHTATHTGASTTPPMGTRLRLKASFDVTTLPSAGAKVVAQALQKYGMLLADGGQIALTAESDQLETTKWGSVLGSTDLQALQVSDFEVVDYPGTTMSTLDCVRSP